MVRRALIAVLGLMLRVSYRRIEVVRQEKVPAEPEPAIFVLNHPNGLVDPLFILCLAPRRVAFLAKSTIFKMPVLGWIARSIECLPVYRQQDEGEDRTKNKETFERTRDLLLRGGTMAIFPEGVSHSEPSLRPLKSGAARIALSARTGLERLLIVPAGLYYTDKETFRSKALVCYGDPIEVPRIELDEDGAPPREAVGALSQRIDQALRAVTLNADENEALEMIGRAERVFSSDAEEATRRTLARELELRRRFQEGYAFFRARDPAAVVALDARIRRYEEEVAAAGLDSKTLQPGYPVGAVLRFVVTRLVLIAVLLPLAAIGVALHYATYRLIGFLAGRYAKGDDDVVATGKLLGSLLLFPITWAAIVVAAGIFGSLRLGLAALVIAPGTGYLAIRFQEILDRTLAAGRAFFAFVARPRFLDMLLAERRAIRDEILRLDRVRSGG